MNGFAAQGLKMGDSYDDDEGRLMIDDAILDSTHSSQPVAANTEAASKTSYEKTVELTPASEDGKHLIKTQPVPLFANTSLEVQ